MIDSAALTEEQQVEMVESFGYFDLMAFLGRNSMHPGKMEATKILFAGLSIDKNSWVLDVGCGTGASSVFAAKRYGCRALGVDGNERMVAQASKAATSENLADRVAFLAVDPHRLPIGSEVFDAAFSEAALGFMPRKQEVLRELRRVCRPHATLGVLDFVYSQRPTVSELARLNSVVGSFLEPLNGDQWLRLFEECGWIATDVVDQPCNVATDAMIESYSREIPPIDGICERARERIAQRLGNFERLFNANRKLLAVRLAWYKNGGQAHPTLG